MPKPSQADVDRTIVLPAGRRLGYGEYGDPAGFPVVLLHDCPGSRVTGKLAHEAAAGGGVRLIAPDRPGFGLSDPVGRRTIAGWADDLAALADALGLERFGVVGLGAGSPFALAGAWRLPGRVAALGIVSGVAPRAGGGSGAGMDPRARLAYRLARWAPWFLRLVVRRIAREAAREPHRLAARLLAARPPVDRAVLERPEVLAVLVEGMPEAFRHPPTIVRELRATGRVWGFPVEEIAVPVFLWHGEEDSVHSLEAARALAERIPGGRAEFVPRAGAAWFVDHAGAVFDALVGEGHGYEERASRTILGMGEPISALIQELVGDQASLIDFFYTSDWALKMRDPAICDFVVGNPHDMPLPEIADALQRWAVPQRKDWFAYKMSEPEPRAVVAASLRARYGIAFEEQDIHLTTGAFGAIAVVLRAVVNPGDEVIFVTPPWFFYETMIKAANGVPVRVPARREGWDLDLDAIEAAITARTRAIIVNSPNNPTGRIYPPETMQALAALLTEASERNERTIYLFSDEAYSRILFDDRPYTTACAYYPDTMLLYTYGKQLLMPGQRIGYIALPPEMPDRATIGQGIFLAQMSVGFAFPNALLQHALGDLDGLCVDVKRLQRRRDRLVEALRGFGYELHVPEGTFYMVPRSPIEDDVAFCHMLGEHDVFVLPGRTVELPGYFRISVTASDDMVERSLPGFEAAFRRATS